MKKNIKTNVMRLLDKEKIIYTPVYYDLGDIEFSGQAVSELTNIPEEQCFKTLCAINQKGAVFIFVIPVNKELDLKMAATASGNKSIELLPLKDLLKTTGYNRGEVSPVGMKKTYPTYIDKSAENFDNISCSAGKKGASVQLSPYDLCRYISAGFAPLS